MDYAGASSEELIRLCLESGDDTAWAEFVRRFHKIIATVALRTAQRWGVNSPEIVDDLIQETYLKLCENSYQLLRTFKPTHQDAFFGYIKVITVNLVHDHFRGLRSQKRGGDLQPQPVDSLDTSEIRTECNSSTTRDLDRNILIREIDNYLLSLNTGSNSARDRRIFWLYYRAGLPAHSIAALKTIGLTTKGVESTILRLTHALRMKLTSKPVQETGPKLESKGIRASDSLS